MMTDQRQYQRSSSSVATVAAAAALGYPWSPSTCMASSSSAAYADGAMHDKSYKEPLVESLDQIAAVREWSRLLLHGPQPLARSKHAAVAVGQNMLVAGGTSPQGTRNDVQVFHAEKLNWELLGFRSPAPELELPGGEGCDADCPSFTGQSLVFWEDKFLLVGGQTGAGTETVTVFSLDVSSGAWSTLSIKGGAPAARTGHIVVQMASVLVLFGGEDVKGKTLNDTYILQLETLLWLRAETKGRKPSPRRDHSGATYSGQYLWIFGGKSRTTYYNDAYRLDLHTMHWTKARPRGPSPTPRAGHSGAIDGKKWYIVGGETRGKEVSNMLVFNLEARTWSNLANIPSGSPLANDGISLVKLQIKERSFLVAFGGHDANLSNQIYVLLLPSGKQLGSYLQESHSSTSPFRSVSFDSRHSSQFHLSPSPQSVRTSSGPNGDGISSTPGSTFSIRECRFGPEPAAHGFVQDAKFPDDDEKVMAGQDPSSADATNDETHYLTREGSNEGRLLRLPESPPERRRALQRAESLPSLVLKSREIGIMGSYRFTAPRDADLNSQYGMHEGWGDLNERLEAALKLNDDLQTKLKQIHNTRLDLEQALSGNKTKTDNLEQEVLSLLTAKADVEWKLENTRQKLEELDRRLNPPSQPRDEADSELQSAPREEPIVAGPHTLRTKLIEEESGSIFEESIFSMEADTSYETQRRLGEAESKLSALTTVQFLTERKLVTASRERRELSEKAAKATQTMEEFHAECKTLRANNLLLEHELLDVKADLNDVREELQAKQVELSQASTRNLELQVEMHELSQKFSGS